ncbi:MAG: hypothetical protein J2P41_11995 [Blastocatellia bacterium]|nr:hypothetical protein [Blastocatellia bacterium]
MRVVISARGEVAWVTARGEYHVLAFDTRWILDDPSHALLSTTPVGS